ncbi:MAG: response regulator [Desulfomonile tiedjei]|nr:response regulator [Desulfomonile tiedjei]
MNGSRDARILVVDDRPDMCATLSRWLTSEGHFCSAASSGEAAIELLKRAEFHLVVSDITVPGLSGIDLVTYMKRSFPNVAVLVVTAVDDREIAVRSVELGAYGYLIKPFDRNEFVVNVSEALERRRLTLLAQEHERGLDAQVQLNEKYGKLVHFFPYGIAEFVVASPIRTDLPHEDLLPSILDAKLTGGNIAFATSHGHDRVDDLMGVTLRAVFPSGKSAGELYRRWIESGFQISSLETIENGLDRDPRHFENTLLGNVQQGCLETFWGIRRDITERKRVQEQLFEKIKIIDELYEHLVQSCKSKAIAEYAARVAHELRQPLAIIGGFARRIGKERPAAPTMDDGPRANAVTIIIQEVERLEKILDRLVDYTSHKTVQWQPVNPNDLVQYVLSIHEPKIKEKGVRLETELGSDVGEIFLDANRFQEVVRNLLTQALEFSLPGELIRVQTAVVVPSERAHETGELDSNTYFELKIHHVGKIIPAEDAEKIFDPFATTKDYGAAIGLVLSKKIVEDHQGSISVRSNEDGTLFTVWLPVARSLS